ncbi:MAG: PUA domain-containing protein, partial [Woeseiaceae bacterium]
LEVQGSIRVDEGAVAALRNGKSLLPVGVTVVTGNFRRGDVVSITGPGGAELGRGLAEYSNEEANQIVGCQSEQIEDKLGYRGRSVMVHRDELVLFENDG